MKKLVTANGIYGPFSNIDKGIDRYCCDGAELPLSVVGEGVIYEVDPGDFPTDSPQQAVPVPESVSNFQAKAALLQAGLLDSVESMMAAPQTPAVARLAWSDAQEFRRTSPTVAAMASALGLSEGQIDDLFRTAAGIVA